jgi:drug/metabolite transporter (DMT)-like permease
MTPKVSSPRSTPAEPVAGADASARSLHRLGVICGLGAGAWLGVASTPLKLVSAGFSPFVLSLGMVLGVFVGRWTIPSLLKGGHYVWQDLREKPHLIVWAILAGMCWSVANTLTVFAIRDVGLSVAFPLWNANSLVGLFWGWALFKELRSGGAKNWLKVLGGTAAIVVGACLLAYATSTESGGQSRQATMGILAALGAAALWGTMYIPYRKAYISGLNPLSFVTVFTFGELGTVLALALYYNGGIGGVSAELSRAKPVLFWLFLGGFCWVLGDLFQQYAAKYIGIGRGIPLSNTNQLWGLAWGALVFGELAGKSGSTQALVIVGSLMMIAGAVAISFAEAKDTERASWKLAMMRECDRYNLDPKRVAAQLHGEDMVGQDGGIQRHWLEWLVVAAAIGTFVWFGMNAHGEPLPINVPWMLVLVALSLSFLVVCGWTLWKRTRFS